MAQLLPLVAPNLPLAPREYDPRYMEQLTNVLRLYFTQIDARLQRIMLGMNHYGVFHSMDSQTASGTGTATVVAFPTAVDAFGVTVPDATPSRITVSRDGLYRVTATLRTDKSGAGAASMHVWFRVNGVDVPGSASKTAVDGTDTETVIVREYVGTLAAGSYVEVVWSTSDTGLALTTAAAASPVPAVPSASVAVTYVFPVGV